MRSIAAENVIAVNELVQGSWPPLMLAGFCHPGKKGKLTGSTELGVGQECWLSWGGRWKDKGREGLKGEEGKEGKNMEKSERNPRRGQREKRC